MSQTSEVGVEESKGNRFSRAFSYMKSHPYYVIGAVIIIVILIVIIYWFTGSKKESAKGKKKKKSKGGSNDDEDNDNERDKINNLIEEIEDGQKQPPQ